MIMTHPGLPLEWMLVILACASIFFVWGLLANKPKALQLHGVSFTKMAIIGPIFSYLNAYTWPLMMLKIIFAAIYLLVVAAGLWGTPIVERNFAAAVTWNLWWTGIVIAILFSGSAWCAVCPWDNIASWLVNHSIWRRPKGFSRLNLKVPKVLRSIWPASLLFIGFTWLELGVGIVASPYATALLALLMIVLAVTVLILFEGKAFCRYMCPVGRTVGAYSQLAFVALRPIDADICSRCTTLECYHGSNIIAPCPTKLVMGRLQENTYCTSCGNCVKSCPSKNISWQLRSPSFEAIQGARPHMDEAFFMLILLALTCFHGFTMLEKWKALLSGTARIINDSGQLIYSFSLDLSVFLLAVIAVYAICIYCAQQLSGKTGGTHYRQYFSGFSFVALPLAFSYHMAHNLNHFFRENIGWIDLIENPLGIGSQPLSMAEKHVRHMSALVPEAVIFSLQALLITAGFFIAMQVIRHRGERMFSAGGVQLLPLFLFALIITAVNVWMLMQPMIMRM